VIVVGQLTLDELSCLREVTQSLRQANELEQQANALHNRHGLNAGQLAQTISEKDREISVSHVLMHAATLFTASNRPTV